MFIFISFSTKNDINPPRVGRRGSCSWNDARPSKGVGKSSWSAPERGTKRDREEPPDAEAPWGDPGVIRAMRLELVETLKGV